MSGVVMYSPEANTIRRRRLVQAPIHAEGGGGTQRTDRLPDERRRKPAGGEPVEGGSGSSRGLLGGGDVLSPRTLRSLAGFKGHRLAFAQIVEPDAVASGAMEEVLAAVLRRHETKPFVTHQPLDRALLCCHRDSN